MLHGGVTLLSGSHNEIGSVIQYHCNEPFYSFPWGENGKTIHRSGFTSHLNDDYYKFLLILSYFHLWSRQEVEICPRGSVSNVHTW